ncbi:hypothetical protein VOLCADRAFT_96423 [Volvox carteri f. nagariensis]|uniref:Pherophorin domain-containing protein n=1 Tax=Volvox carteri f. nagariensis TaxID=3068 RepID=D8UA24_VOLCA|nr:uncharacterized protein VOLCADRAFT_96423 [Volvox carteri f. nagariensis]EFJ43398.1 hypothetical protein VOLCADRAFT_96423 [Volvox carteri f. nagariensis]|eukprot:XP_002955545.1 hypothetical protein VOLCADRAFT_96423 [Volvox carteri f. nagariensis]
MHACLLASSCALRITLGDYCKSTPNTETWTADSGKNPKPSLTQERDCNFIVQTLYKCKMSKENISQWISCNPLSTENCYFFCVNPDKGSSSSRFSSFSRANTASGSTPSSDGATAPPPPPTSMEAQLP